MMEPSTVDDAELELPPNKELPPEAETPGCDVFQHSFMDWGISVEDLLQEQKDDYNPNKEWVDINEPKKARATVGVAVTEAWEQAQKEFSHIWSKLKDRLSSKHPSFDAIFELVFGKDSEVFKVLQRLPIFENHDEYLLFLATFFCRAPTKFQRSFSSINSLAFGWMEACVKRTTDAFGTRSGKHTSRL